MAYSEHNFLPGQMLTADIMNEIDAQVKKNSDGVEAFNKQTISEEINKLTLDSDSEYIYLLYDGRQISEAPVPLNWDDFIACEGLTVIGYEGESLYVNEGEEHQYSTTVTPSDTTQRVRWKSGDSNVASVTSEGVVEGIALGSTKVTCMCGKFKTEIPVLVSRTYKKNYHKCSYMQKTSDSLGVYVSCDPGENRACITDEELVLVKAGTNLSVLTDDVYAIQNLLICKPLDESGFNASGSLEDGDKRRIRNLEVLEESGVIAKNSSYEYEATEDCYVFGFCMHAANASQPFTDEELTTIKDHITISVTPIQYF